MVPRFFPFLFGGVLCLVLFLLSLCVWVPLLLVLSRAAGFGLVGLCPLGGFALAFLPRPLVCSCRFGLAAWLLRSRGRFLVSAGVLGFALVLRVLRFGRLVRVLFLFFVSRWPCLLVGLRVRGVWFFGLSCFLCLFSCGRCGFRGFAGVVPRVFPFGFFGC